MNQSLSIVLPVRNAQETLGVQVARLLDVLPDLGARFEIVIVDDASADNTDDIARELAREYPQVRVIRHHRPLGAPAAIQDGISQSTGDVVFVQEDSSPPLASDLRELWDMRNEPDLVSARAEPRLRPLDPRLIERLVAWGRALQRRESADARTESPARGMQMIRCDALRQLRDGQTLDDFRLERIVRRRRSEAASEPPPRGDAVGRKLTAIQ